MVENCQWRMLPPPVMVSSPPAGESPHVNLRDQLDPLGLQTHNLEVDHTRYRGPLVQLLQPKPDPKEWAERLREPYYMRVGCPNDGGHPEHLQISKDKFKTTHR
jgi:hypothetical protein